MMSAMARYRCEYPMRWSDMDAYGHVNNVQYLRFFEDARIEAFAVHRAYEDGGSLLERGLLVARHEIEYVRPLKWRPEPVHIDLWIIEARGARVDVGYEVYDAPDGGERIRYAVAESTLVVYDLATERPKRLSEADLGRLEGLRDAAVPFRTRPARRSLA